MAQRRIRKGDFTTLVKSKSRALSNRRCKESLLWFPAFDRCTGFGDEQAAGFGAKERDLEGVERGNMVRGLGGNRPLDLAEASWLAELFDEALGFLVGDQSGDAIHAGLAVHGIAQGGGDGFAEEKRTPIS